MSETRDIVSERFTLAQEKALEAGERAFELISYLAQATDIDITLDSLPFSFRQLVVDDHIPASPDRPDISIILPNAPIEPDILFSLLFQSTLKEAVETYLLAKIEEGGTGLGVAVEEAIWQRARDRRALVNEQTYEEALEFFAARGWSIPTGALMARVAEANREIARSEEQFSYEIAIEQARLAKRQEEFILQACIGWIKDLLIEQARAEAEKNNVLINKYKTDIDAYTARIKATTDEAEILGRLYGYDVQAYGADIEKAKVQIDGDIKSYEIMEAHEVNQLQIQLKHAEINLQSALKQRELQQEAIRMAAQMASQIAASWLSSLSASTSLGFSEGESHSFDETKTIPSTSHVYHHQD